MNGNTLFPSCFPLQEQLMSMDIACPYKNDKLNLFCRCTLQPNKRFCCKVSPAKAKELVTESLFYNNNIQGGNNTTQKMDSKGCLSHLPSFT